MAGNLRDRLQRIQLVKNNNAPVKNRGQVVLQGWSNAGYMTLRREITSDSFFALPKVMPEAAHIVMPGINSLTGYGDLLFFDLETTGLSGGAGTVAFLAAFGRLVYCDSTEQAARYKLCITQYLLLDYPGESDFINALAVEFSGNNCTMVSYNGKCFDSQILNTRCLMNGLHPPEYRHADLLHPARRLWKRHLENCSQACVETQILGIDREGDIPGSMAPDIWFAFLRDGETAPLMGICEHNRRDIEGLARIFSLMAQIAEKPLKARGKYLFDLEALSMRYALILRRAGKRAEARTWLLQAAGGDSPGEMAGYSPIRVAALRALAIDSERRLKNNAEALALAEQALRLLPPDSHQQAEFMHRTERLRKKRLGLTTREWSD